jgi:hypothetical protein
MSLIMTPGTKLFHTLHTVAGEYHERCQPWYTEQPTMIRKRMRATPAIGFWIYPSFQDL